MVEILMGEARRYLHAGRMLVTGERLTGGRARDVGARRYRTRWTQWLRPQARAIEAMRVLASGSVALQSTGWLSIDFRGGCRAQ